MSSKKTTSKGPTPKRKSSSRKKQEPTRRGRMLLGVLAIGVVMGLGIAYLSQFRVSDVLPVEVEPTATSAVAQKTNTPTPTLPATADATPATPAKKKLGEPPYLALVLDDFGDSLELAERAARLPVPVTFAIIPFRRHSAEISRLAAKAGKEVILHMPMEPESYPLTDPGEGALLLSSTPDDIALKFNEALDTVPDAVGVNNHMGSAFTANEAKMRTFLKLFEGRSLFFLDSVTIGSTKGELVARQLGIPTSRRDVFLDNSDDPNEIRVQIRAWWDRALSKKQALAIGHARKSTILVLEQTLPLLQKEPLTFVTVSDYVSL